MDKAYNYEHVGLKVSKEQRENLLKLSKYLSDFETDGVGDFDMSTFHLDTEGYCEGDGHDILPFKAHYDCYTVACAVGHGPAAGIPSVRGDTWYSYAMRSFGTRATQYDQTCLLWKFLFHFRWGAHDNTASGAARRIRYALEHGVPVMRGHTDMATWEGTS